MAYRGALAQGAPGLSTLYPLTEVEHCMLGAEPQQPLIQGGRNLEGVRAC